MDLYMAPNGNNRASGLKPEAKGRGFDGPLASIEGAVKKIRTMAGTGRLDGPVTVHMRGGTYCLDRPAVFGPEDSWPVTFKPYRGEKPVISGGRKITGWKHCTVNGKRAWVADLPEVREGKWAFRSLFVNGKRAPRPRMPAKGLYRMAEVPGMETPVSWGQGGYTRFVCAEGDIKEYANLKDVEVVYVHFWIEERSPLAAFDPDTGLVTMERPSRGPLTAAHGSRLADYYLDNVFEGLKKPGQWYLDRKEGRLYYIPRRGQTPRTTEIRAPRTCQLLAFLGNVEQNRLVENIRFEGLAFRDTDWRHPSEDGVKVYGSSDPGRPPSHSRRHNRKQTASSSQAASDVPGVITFEGARHCAIENCRIENVGWYGIEAGDACRGIRISGNKIRETGAGGVKINGASARDPQVTKRRTGSHVVSDNVISAGGRVFHSAVGVLCMHAFDVRIAHNRIHDLYYSGISCGWEWGYQESVSRDNIIEYNHIHDIGQGLLSDMGGIYTLGVQPGTVLRNNLIHDVRSAHYGGWCIYPDEGSSHILIENNICCDADREAFHQHYGRENMITNNIFAFGGKSAATFSRGEDHTGFTFLRNIFVGRGVPMFSTGYAYRFEDRRHRSELNLFFDVDGNRVVFEDASGVKVSFRRWRELGYDRSSIAADPGFRNIAGRDFRLASDSPAFRLGFRPIDMRGVGPRPKSRRD
ncbi:MAG: right-handed parallel beta-helix repeat-containing protein [Kiritimatiellia bacterium]